MTKEEIVQKVKENQQKIETYRNDIKEMEGMNASLMSQYVSSLEVPKNIELFFFKEEADKIRVGDHTLRGSNLNGYVIEYIPERYKEHSESPPEIPRKFEEISLQEVKASRYIAFYIPEDIKDIEYIQGYIDKPENYGIVMEDGIICITSEGYIRKTRIRDDYKYYKIIKNNS